MSTLISQICLYAASLIYTACLKDIRASQFNPLSGESLKAIFDCHKLGRYVKLVVPSTLMFCFEWSALQFIILIAGYISTVALAAQVILHNTLF